MSSSCNVTSMSAVSTAKGSLFRPEYPTLPNILKSNGGGELCSENKILLAPHISKMRYFFYVTVMEATILSKGVSFLLK